MTNAETGTTDRDKIAARIVCEVLQACLDTLADDGELLHYDEQFGTDEQMAAHLLVRIMVTGLDEGRLNLRTW